MHSAKHIQLRLISRLGIQLEAIVVAHQARAQQMLNAIAYQIHHHQYAIAADNQRKIRFECICNVHDQKRYTTTLRIVALFCNNAPAASITFFGRVFAPLVNSERDLTGILATLGLGLAYADCQLLARSRVYIALPHSMLCQASLSDSKYLDIA